MRRPLIRWTWEAFDKAVGVLHRRLRGVPLEGVFGEPRGGLPLAVALSHRLALPFSCCPGPHILWCDDIADTGGTLLQNARKFHTCAVLIANRDLLLPDNAVSAMVKRDPTTWIVFPWELDPSEEELRRGRSSTA